MAVNKINIATILILYLISGCVEPYEAENLDYEQYLVVEGLITDEPGPYTVQLSYTIPVDTFYFDGISNAEVWVTDNHGNREDFTETQNGVYESSDSFRGVAGDFYQLHIKTIDGNEFESEVQKLIKSPEISNIYSSYLEKASSSSDEVFRGLQFFIDVDELTEQASQFRYEWSDTYQIIPDFPTAYEIGPDTFDVMLREVDIATCYRTRFSSGLILANSTNLEAGLKEAAINFVDVETNVLRNRYSLLVRQYTLTPEAYSYYRKVKEMQDGSGSLFDQQQGQIIGNLYHINDPDFQVLGYFEVAGVSQKRAFFKNREFDSRVRVSGTLNCTEDDIIDQDYVLAVGNPTASNYAEYTIWDFLVNNPELYLSAPYNIISYDPIMGTMTAAPYDCTACDHNASIEEPDFWPEKFY